MALASESGHWYDRQGEPVYEVPYASKEGMRPTTLRDARKLLLVPSVSGICGMLEKFQLGTWKEDQLMDSLLYLVDQDWTGGMPGNQLKDEARARARGKMEEITDKGTQIHAAIERYHTGSPLEMESEEHQKVILAVSEALSEAFGDKVEGFRSEHSFAHPLGFGGKVDDHNENIIVDYKTKDFGPEDKVKGWPEHARQLAAYRFGLGYPEAQCANVFISRSHPGEVRVFVWEEEDLQRELDIFMHLLAVWQIGRKYESGWEVENES